MKCKAHRTNGEPCKAYAVKGTTVCRVHGGRAPQTLAKAKKTLEEQKAREKAQTEIKRLTGRINIDPAQALLDLVHSTAGEVAYWQARVDQLQAENEKALTGGLTSVTDIKENGSSKIVRKVETLPAIEYRMLVDAKNRLAHYATSALKAGVEERRVKLAEAQGLLVAQVIKAILDRLNLTSKQQELVPYVVPEELRRLQGG